MLKTLPELRMEIELGIAVYPTDTGDFCIQKPPSGYITCWCTATSKPYNSFDDLLADITTAHESEWTTTRIPAHIEVFERERRESEEYWKQHANDTTPDWGNPFEE